MKRLKIQKGFKRFLGIGPKKPIYKNYWQKGAPNKLGDGTARTPIFLPKDYEAKNSEETRKLAYEDAKNHARFYERLIREGIYPEETKVKVKKIKHSNAYGLELFIPEIKISNSPFIRFSRLAKKIQEIAEEFGYYEKLHEDIRNYWNYGKDQKGKVRYIDAEILYPDRKLPFEMRKKKDLGNKLLGLVSIVGIASSLFFLSPSLTGNAVADLSVNSSSFLGVGLLVVGLIAGVWWGRKRK